MAIPYLTVKEPRAVLSLYGKAFGATTGLVMDGPDDAVIHAEMNIGGQRLMLSGEWPGFSAAPVGRSPVNFMLYVDNLDDALKQALDAGMTLTGEPEMMFWGDRVAKLDDGHGYEWTLAQSVEEVSEDDLKKRLAEWMTSMQG